jgi:hypothetical protein
MAKPIPNILDDLLFHTMPDDHTAPTRRDDDADRAQQTADWTPPDWSRDDTGHQTGLPIHPDRLPALRVYAAAEGVSLRDAVDRALALLLSRPRP